MENKKSLIEQCNEILGEDIFNHELIRLKPNLHFEIQQCKKMDDVVDILNREYKKKNGRYLSLPGGGRNQYRKYIGENANPVQPKTNIRPPRKKRNKKPSIVGDYLRRHAADCDKSVNTNTKRIQTEEEKLYLQRQTVDQFRINKQVQRLLSQPSENFHYA